MLIFHQPSKYIQCSGLGRSCTLRSSIHPFIHWLVDLRVYVREPYHVPGTVTVLKIQSWKRESFTLWGTSYILRVGGWRQGNSRETNKCLLRLIPTNDKGCGGGQYGVTSSKEKRRRMRGYVRFHLKVHGLRRNGEKEPGMWSSGRQSAPGKGATSAESWAGKESSTSEELEEGPAQWGWGVRLGMETRLVQIIEACRSWWEVGILFSKWHENLQEGK